MTPRLQVAGPGRHGPTGQLRTVAGLVIVAMALLVSSCASPERPELMPEGAPPSTPPADTSPPVPVPPPLVSDDPSPEPAPTEAAVAPPANPLPAGPTLGCLSTRQRAGQLLVPLITQPELASAVPFSTEGQLGGVVLLGESDNNLGASLATLQTGPFPVVISSDEEGGIVQRLTNLLGPLPSAQELAQRTPEEVRALFKDYGERMLGLGITVDLAPVVDVGGGPGIGTRSFGTDAETVTIYARAVIQGLLDAGVTPVIKHFPGHGRASADSHLELPQTPPLDELRTLDLVPFQTLLGESFDGEVMVMVGHLSVPGLSDGTPTSLSPNTITGLLRNELGYDGIVMADALDMGAIVNNFTPQEALLRSIEAGVDMAIISGTIQMPVLLDAIEGAVENGRISQERIDQSAGRVLALKGVANPCP